MSKIGRGRRTREQRIIDRIARSEAGATERKNHKGEGVLHRWLMRGLAPMVDTKGNRANRVNRRHSSPF